MKRIAIVFVMVALYVCFSIPASAHFGMVIPSDSMVMKEDNRDVTLNLSFSHPFEMAGMDLDKPDVFGVVAGGKQNDLLGKLAETKVMGHKAWRADYRIGRPGAYLSYMESKPYWEPAEDCFNIHYTKTAVGAFGDDEGWDAEIGLKTEIVPLSKPFGLYAGNVFQGIVKLNGKPVPYSEVEVEFYNEEKKAKAPTDYMITQTIKADGNGIFTYAAPKAGWWGFAALNPSEKKLKKDGQEKEVELGAVIWVCFHEWK